MALNIDKAERRQNWQLSLNWTGKFGVLLCIQNTRALLVLIKTWTLQNVMAVV